MEPCLHKNSLRKLVYNANSSIEIIRSDDTGATVTSLRVVSEAQANVDPNACTTRGFPSVRPKNKWRSERFVKSRFALFPPAVQLVANISATINSGRNLIHKRTMETQDTAN